MSKYELAVVLSSAIEDEARLAALERVKEYVTRFGGNITNIDEWGKKKLAYDIAKMSEAYYYFIKFEAEAEAPAEIEAHIRLMEQVIRFLIVKEEA
ncbi:MAG: 30S ribosomal protein S6 [Lachnospiraceae bacterium]|nr:30S ribosomal protein S6 [Lachnospiraceae bacterium]